MQSTTPIVRTVPTCTASLLPHRPRAPRPVSAHADFRNADDLPGEHDPSKGVDHHSRRGSLEEPVTAAAAAQPSETADVSSPVDRPSSSRQSGSTEEIERGTSYYAADEGLEDDAEVCCFVTVPAGKDHFVLMKLQGTYAPDPFTSSKEQWKLLQSMFKQVS